MEGDTWSPMSKAEKLLGTIKEWSQYFYLDKYANSRDRTGDLKHSSPSLQSLRYDDHNKELGIPN